MRDFEKTLKQKSWSFNERNCSIREAAAERNTYYGTLDKKESEILECAQQL